MKRMMKNRCFGLFIFACVFYLFMPALKAEDEFPFPDPEATISMDFQDANLRDILKIFSVQSGLNFIASEAVKERKVTLYMDKVPIREAMDKIFKANNLSYELDEDSNIFIVKDWGVPQVETVTKVFRLKHATVSSSALKGQMSADMSESGSAGASTGEGNGITGAVTKLLSSSGVVVEDPRTNSLIITDIPSKMPVIAQTIALLDVPTPQVLIEVEMLDVSKNVVDKMGFDFGSNPFTFVFSGEQPGAGGHRGTGTFIGNWGLRGRSLFESGAPSPAGAVIFGRTFAQTLDFLRTQTDTKYLARPRLLTLNNETAEIKITTNESIGVSSTITETSNTTEPERAETGVSLRVTPQINPETGEITMFIYPKVSEATAGTSFSVGSTTYSYRDPEERSTKTIVKVKDGDTVIIGGLIRNEFSEVKTKVPILGDLPIIGALFRHRGSTSDKNKQRELLVFITPHIVKDKNFAQGYLKKTNMVPAREQSKVSTFDRQLAIAASLNNFEKAR